MVDRTALVAELILASGSPRRAELLSEAGLKYRVIIPDIDEAVRENESSMNYVRRMSGEKARFVAALPASQAKVVLAADTIVVIDGYILGKPVDQTDAVAMLQRLSGRTHQVVTSVSVQYGTTVDSVLVETNVQFRTLSIDECTRYWMTGEPEDKAGAYGIQGLASVFVENFEGSYSNVVGLPLAETSTLLTKFGLECPPGFREESIFQREVIQHG
jgi:nucleoside triphosphate pyrophosphatase